MTRAYAALSASRRPGATAGFLNLFAGRATEPRQLFTSFDDPIGPGNDAALQGASFYREVIVAWGANGSRLGRDIQVLTQLDDMGIRPKCIGITKHGHPRHPLYVRGDAKRIRFRWEAIASSS